MVQLRPPLLLSLISLHAFDSRNLILNLRSVGLREQARARARVEEINVSFAPLFHDASEQTEKVEKDLPAVSFSLPLSLSLSP